MDCYIGCLCWLTLTYNIWLAGMFFPVCSLHDVNAAHGCLTDGKFDSSSWDQRVDVFISLIHLGDSALWKFKDPRFFIKSRVNMSDSLLLLVKSPTVSCYLWNLWVIWYCSDQHLVFMAITEMCTWHLCHTGQINSLKHWWCISQGIKVVNDTEPRI